MIAYIDSSVLLRVALNQSAPLKEFRNIKLGVSSRLLRAECLRTLDRLFATERISDSDQSAATLFVLKALDHIEQISLDEIIDSVGNPLGLKLGTLDAIHLFSALKWKEVRKKDLIFLTHDASLAAAVQRFGIHTLGV